MTVTAKDVQVHQITVPVPMALGALVVILAGVMALYSMAGELRKEMVSLDDKWQTRTLEMEERIRSEIKGIGDTPSPVLSFLESEMARLEVRLTTLSEERARDRVKQLGTDNRLSWIERSIDIKPPVDDRDL